MSQIVSPKHMIYIDGPALLKREDAIRIRKEAKMDVLDRRHGVQAVFVLTDKVKAASETFVEELLGPSYLFEAFTSLVSAQPDGRFRITHGRQDPTYVILHNPNDPADNAGECFHDAHNLGIRIMNKRYAERKKLLARNDAHIKAAAGTGRFQLADDMGASFKAAAEERDDFIFSTPYRVTLNRPRMMSVEDAQDIRARLGMPAWDESAWVALRIVIGPKVEEISETFVRALMTPSFQAGHGFEYQRLDGTRPEQDEPVSAYTLVEPADPTRLQERANGEFQHYANRLYMEFWPEKKFGGERRAEIITQGRNPKAALKVLNEFGKFERLQDMGQALLADFPEQDDVIFRHSSHLRGVKPL